MVNPRHLLAAGEPTEYAEFRRQPRICAAKHALNLE
jgi:hypothetical protein